MRILALVTEAYGGHGGIAQAARDMIGAFAAIDHVEAIDVLPRHVAETPGPVPPKVCQRPSLAGRVRYTARALAAASSQTDLVFCNHLYMAPLAVLAARRARARCIIQLHGIEIWTEPTRLQRKALEQVDRLLCVSRNTRAHVLTHCDIDPERAIVVNNTVDPRFSPAERSSARQRFELDDAFALLIVGRIDQRERYKGHDQIIAALPDLKHPDGRRIVFLIAGDGNDRGRLETLAHSTGVLDQVRFLGQVPTHDLPDLYRAADLFVLPSTGEGFGIVFLEAMACGTPALGLAAGGAPDALGDGRLGTVVGSMDKLPDALQVAIESTPPEATMLSKQVNRQFGERVFRERVALGIR